MCLQVRLVVSWFATLTQRWNRISIRDSANNSRHGAIPFMHLRSAALATLLATPLASVQRTCTCASASDGLQTSWLPDGYGIGCAAHDAGVPVLANCAGLEGSTSKLSSW